MYGNHLNNRGDVIPTKGITSKRWALGQVENPNCRFTASRTTGQVAFKAFIRNRESTVYGMVPRASLSITILLFSAVVFLASAPARSQPDERILARICDKRISVKEFLERSELTVRPGVFKNKNISLNNLISEKILALEAEHNNRHLSPASQSTLQGIKEQTMRRQLYYVEAHNKVTFDSAEVKNAYRLSMREYELEFYSLRNKKLARRIEAAFDSIPGRTDDIFKGLEEYFDKKPLHTANYLDDDDVAIHEALYTESLNVGAVVGPLKLGNGDYILMKVTTWTDHPLISGEDQQVRWNKVQEKIHAIKAEKLWRSYQASVMRGKTMEFDKETFMTLSNWAMKKYFSDKSKSDSLKFRITELPIAKPLFSDHAPFFTIDKKVWTVGDFRRELMSHPLVYRTTDLDSGNFREQFKLAVVDMMRDRTLTQEAYKKSLDTNADVKKTVAMWKDSFLAGNEAKSVMDAGLKQGTIRQDDNAGMSNYWDKHLRELQKKYGNSIQIDYHEFNNLSLTTIDMFAWWTGMPYPAAVPPFPTFMASENMDYAKQGK